MTAALEDRLDALARQPQLLVSCDYDGTLAPIVDDPAHARPLREAMAALRSLAELPKTYAAIISGRALNDLHELIGGAPDSIHLVGSHGSEFEPGYIASMSADQMALRESVREELAAIAEAHPGCSVEAKPASVAFHYRNAAPDVGERARQAVMDGPAARAGVHTKLGKMVVELGVVVTDKGSAFRTVRRRVGATAAIFIGDDVTDEDAFATLAGPDIGIKVGEGDSIARFRVEDPEAVGRTLAQLCEARQAWLAGSRATPIERHAMLSDQRTIALVTPDANIVWLCAPRIDSPALFAELVGGPDAGSFSVRPADGSEPTGQHYDTDSMLLHTRWPTLNLIDYLDCSDGRPIQRAGRLELVRVIEASADAVIEFAPRLDFGRTPTTLRVEDDGLVVEGSLDPIVLRAPGVRWEIVEDGLHHTARAHIKGGGGPIALELRYGAGVLRASRVPEHERRRQTARYWGKWSSRLRLPSVRPDLVRRSALTLKGLVQGPTGAVAAAGTTSLPESMGGVRNWDYRYCWPRDAAMSCLALTRLGSITESLQFLDWMLEVVDDAGSAERLSPIYTVAGHELGAEGVLDELPGYAGSRPVRVGNAASRQIQLDVFGPIVELIAELTEAGAPLSPDHWRLAEAMIEAVSRRWSEPDHGIWEIRAERRHHVHSKVMCWLTADRSARIAEAFLGQSRTDYIELRDSIAAEIFEHGWNEGLGTFTATYDGAETDAAVLAVGLSGLVASDDPRFLGTIDAVERELRNGPTVYRYTYDDGLPGAEGGFHLCTTWLIEALAMTGHMDRARELFDQFVALAGPTGLMPEEYDPETRTSLGNHPQAYTHLGLVNAALVLDRNGGS